MKIASASLQMASSHASLQHHELRESLKAWVGQRRPDFAGETPRPRPPISDPVSLSAAGKASQANESSEEADAIIDSDAKLSLIRSMLEFLTGYKIRIFDAGELQGRGESSSSDAQSNAAAPPLAGYGVEYDRQESYTEAEETSFSAQGTVKTADGKEISFDLQLSMSRYFHEESSTSLRLGDAARKTDPLVLNFTGTAAQLSDQRFAFDLNADGQTENINFLAPGSGFLVFDRNGDGKINDGRELFGPISSNGFAELTELDSDKNGWIDENDSSYKNLQIWSPDKQSQENLKSLAEARVGAISLSHVASPFELKTQNNELLGQVRSSGIFLQEDGLAGTIQQIDLTA